MKKVREYLQKAAVTIVRRSHFCRTRLYLHNFYSRTLVNRPDILQENFIKNARETSYLHHHCVGEDEERDEGDDQGVGPVYYNWTHNIILIRFLFKNLIVKYFLFKTTYLNLNISVY